MSRLEALRNQPGRMASGSAELYNRFEQIIARDPRNSICIDCGAAIDMQSQSGWGMWGSVSNGCFFCMQCSGRHRSIGVHLSFVRSTVQDDWKPEQLQMMESGGNGALMDFLESQGVDTRMKIEEKYATVPCVAYRLILRAKAEGVTPIPRAKYALKAAKWVVGPGNWGYKAGLERAVADTQKRLEKEELRRADKVHYTPFPSKVSDTSGFKVVLTDQHPAEVGGANLEADTAVADLLDDQRALSVTPTAELPQDESLHGSLSAAAEVESAAAAAVVGEESSEVGTDRSAAIMARLADNSNLGAIKEALHSRLEEEAVEADSEQLFEAGQDVELDELLGSVDESPEGGEGDLDELLGSGDESPEGGEGELDELLGSVDESPEGGEGDLDELLGSVDESPEGGEGDLDEVLGSRIDVVGATCEGSTLRAELVLHGDESVLEDESDVRWYRFGLDEWEEVGHGLQYCVTSDDVRHRLRAAYFDMVCDTGVVESQEGSGGNLDELLRSGDESQKGGEGDLDELLGSGDESQVCGDNEALAVEGSLSAAAEVESPAAAAAAAVGEESAQAGTDRTAAIMARLADNSNLGAIKEALHSRLEEEAVEADSEQLFEAGQDVELDGLLGRGDESQKGGEGDLDEVLSSRIAVVGATCEGSTLRAELVLHGDESVLEDGSDVRWYRFGLDEWEEVGHGLQYCVTSDDVRHRLRAAYFDMVCDTGVVESQEGSEGDLDELLRSGDESQEGGEGDLDELLGSGDESQVCGDNEALAVEGSLSAAAEVESPAAPAAAVGEESSEVGRDRTAAIMARLADNSNLGAIKEALHSRLEEEAVEADSEQLFEAGQDVELDELLRSGYSDEEATNAAVSAASMHSLASLCEQDGIGSSRKQSLEVACEHEGSSGQENQAAQDGAGGDKVHVAKPTGARVARSTSASPGPRLAQRAVKPRSNAAFEARLKKVREDRAAKEAADNAAQQQQRLRRNQAHPSRSSSAPRLKKVREDKAAKEAADNAAHQEQLRRNQARPSRSSSAPRLKKVREDKAAKEAADKAAHQEQLRHNKQVALAKNAWRRGTRDNQQPAANESMGAAGEATTEKVVDQAAPQMTKAHDAVRVQAMLVSNQASNAAQKAGKEAVELLAAGKQGLKAAAASRIRANDAAENAAQEDAAIKALFVKEASADGVLTPTSGALRQRMAEYAAWEAAVTDAQEALSTALSSGDAAAIAAAEDALHQAAFEKEVEAVKDSQVVRWGSAESLDMLHEELAAENTGKEIAGDAVGSVNEECAARRDGAVDAVQAVSRGSRRGMYSHELLRQEEHVPQTGEQEQDGGRACISGAQEGADDPLNIAELNAGNNGLGNQLAPQDVGVRVKNNHTSNCSLSLQELPSASIHSEPMFVNEMPVVVSPQGHAARAPKNDGDQLIARDDVNAAIERAQRTSNIMSGLLQQLNDMPLSHGVPTQRDSPPPSPPQSSEPLQQPSPTRSALPGSRLAERAVKPRLKKAREDMAAKEAAEGAATAEKKEGASRRGLSHEVAGKLRKARDLESRVVSPEHEIKDGAGGDKVHVAKPTGAGVARSTSASPGPRLAQRAVKPPLKQARPDMAADEERAAHQEQLGHSEPRPHSQPRTHSQPRPLRPSALPPPQTPEALQQSSPTCMVPSSSPSLPALQSPMPHRYQSVASSSVKERTPASWSSPSKSLLSYGLQLLSSPSPTKVALQHSQGEEFKTVEAEREGPEVESPTRKTTVFSEKYGSAGFPMVRTKQDPKKMDTNKDGVVDAEEFAAAGGSKEEFSKYDVNGDGVLDADELARRSAAQAEAAQEVSGKYNSLLTSLKKLGSHVEEHRCDGSDQDHSATTEAAASVKGAVAADSMDGPEKQLVEVMVQKNQELYELQQHLLESPKKERKVLKERISQLDSEIAELQKGMTSSAPSALQLFTTQSVESAPVVPRLNLPKVLLDEDKLLKKKAAPQEIARVAENEGNPRSQEKVDLEAKQGVLQKALTAQGKTQPGRLEEAAACSSDDVQNVMHDMATWWRRYRWQQMASTEVGADIGGSRWHYVSASNPKADLVADQNSPTLSWLHEEQEQLQASGDTAIANPGQLTHVRRGSKTLALGESPPENGLPSPAPRPHCCRPPRSPPPSCPPKPSPPCSPSDALSPSDKYSKISVGASHLSPNTSMVALVPGAVKGDAKKSSQVLDKDELEGPKDHLAKIMRDHHQQRRRLLNRFSTSATHRHESVPDEAAASAIRRRAPHWNLQNWHLRLGLATIAFSCTLMLVHQFLLTIS